MDSMEGRRLPDSKPDALLFVVKDVCAELVSPVFEQSSVKSAERVFAHKTLKELPEGVEKSELELWFVGERHGHYVYGVSPQICMRGEEVLV